MPTTNFTLTTTATQVLPAATEHRHYLRLTNVNVTGSIWWTDEPGVTPGANVAGCYELAPGTANSKEYSSQEGPESETYVPQGVISAVAATGTAALTVEVSG